MAGNYSSQVQVSEEVNEVNETQVKKQLK